MTYTLNDAQLMAQANPGKFEAPSQQDLDALKPGDLVKLCFSMDIPGRERPSRERMWVIIRGMKGDEIIGELNNEPFEMPGLRCGDVVHFEPRNIYSIYR